MLSDFQFAVNNSSNYYTSIIKISATNSISWQASYSFHPTTKSLSVDSVEQYFYFATINNPAKIIKSDTSNGAVASAHHIKSFKTGFIVI